MASLSKAWLYKPDKEFKRWILPLHLFFHKVILELLPSTKHETGKIRSLVANTPYQMSERFEFLYLPDQVLIDRQGSSLTSFSELTKRNHHHLKRERPCSYPLNPIHQGLLFCSYRLDANQQDDTHSCLLLDCSTESYIRCD